MKKPVLGAQLYTVRDHMKTLPDIVKGLKRVADIGYTTVQVSGVGKVDPKDLAAALRDNGLACVATHIGWDRCLNDLDGVIRDHKAWGCRHVAIGGLPEAYHGADGLKRFVGELAPVCERLAKEGMDFSYHNHAHEFVRVGAKTWLETLYDSTSPDLLKAELDTYWVQTGGGDPAAWVRKLAGREPLLHLKDMAIGPDKKQRFAEIGEGNLNWTAILKAAEESGVESLLIEQDLCYERDPFESLAISYRNLSRMGYR
jgi:sugar phosphate isomerase/epimerase